MKGIKLANIAIGGVVVGLGAGLIAINVVALARSRRVRGY